MSNILDLFERKKHYQLIGLEYNKYEEYYTVKYNRWRFEYSDEVYIDGELISKGEKAGIMLGFYNIRPKPKTIRTSDTCNGVPLIEIDFIEAEINRILKIKEEELSPDDKVLRREYLKFLQSKKTAYEEQNNQNLNIKDNLTLEIDEIFNSNPEGWKYYFKYESDYNTFIKLLAKFSKNEDIDIPERTIPMRNRCKTKLAKELRDFHKEFTSNKILRNDTVFFNIIRILEPFKDCNDDEIYNALIK